MTPKRIAAVVLAGGQARRMGGGDKALMTVRGRLMLDHVVAGLDGLTAAISANGDAARFARYGLPVLTDGEFAGRGPLAGVLAGLEWAAGLGMTEMLTVPGDSPFLPHRLDEALAPAPGCASCGGMRHHLVALWPVAVCDLLRTFLSQNESGKVSRFAEQVGMRYVDFPTTLQGSFVNVNTPDDLAQVNEGW
jgi:molybdopterin-guanine dinucleotide biosynthesis protein A